MIYLFNNDEEMIRIIPNSAIKRMYQTQTLTDENYISDRLDVEILALNDEELSELEYMAIDDIENPQRFHYYFIVKETTEHQITSLTGVQSGIEELRKTPIYDMRPANRSPKFIADRLLEGTNWQTGYTTDDVGTISTNFYYTDVFSALKKMCMAFGIEMQFFVEITTNRIGARYIEFRKRTGKSVGKRVVYGHNALKIVKEVEKTNTVTALIGRGKGVQVSESDEGNIGYGRKIGFENVEWKASSGAPVDKPIGQEFVEIPELTLQCGIKNSNGTVRPKIGFVEFQDEESETRLINRTYDALLELSRPQVLLETSSVYLPDTGIGDTINVVRHDRDLRYQTRVFEITWDRLANKAVDMKLGDRLGESENKRISRISSQVSGNISTELGPTIDELVDRLTTADGKNTNWYTDYDPMENLETMGLVRVNDNWWQPDPEYEGEFILKQWNGEMWVEILRTSGNPELVRRFEEIESQAEELTKDIEVSDQKATEAKEEAGLAKSASEAAETIAQQAQAEAESAKTNSSEALEKAILAGTDAETAKQNALDAVGQASTAKQDATDALGKAGEAVIKANDAIGKANQIPQDIQNEIESKGLVSGSWVESHVNDVTGEINYALAEVSGSIPTVVLGVVWDKSESPILTRTDYVEEYANLSDYLLKTNEIDFNIDGLSGRMSEVESNKLDGTEFTSFKTNDYDVTVDGFNTALTDKLDTETFNTFKTNEFEMTVDGINGSIESLQTEKLDSADFNTFKSNDYELTVDGLRMDLSSVSGSIPTIIMGVEWDKSQNPELTRTDYLEYDNPNLYSPSFVMGVRWDKSENPELYRTDDTGGVDGYEYSQQTAQFISDISGLSGRVESVETNKLGANEFNSFKTNTYDVDLQGLRTNITSLDENKLGSDEFSDFKTNTFDVSVNGLSGRIGTVETEKLDSETYETFKTNTYDVEVSGLKTRMSSVETNKLDSGTFNTFKDTTYSNTIEGINGSISTLQQDKLDNQDFNSFKQNEYEVTVDGLKMSLTEVTGASPTIVLGVEWDKSSEPSLERTDFSVGYADSDEFESLQADYEFTKENWSTRLSQIENAGYATQSWSNQTFATPQSVSTQLQSYAKTTDLNGMVTETTLATKNFITAGSVNSLLTSYAKTGDVPTTTQFNSLKNRYDSMEQIIGTDKDSVARAVMTSNLWETEVSKVIDSELEQEYETVNAKVNVVNGGRDSKYGEDFSSGRYFYFNNDDGHVQGILFSGTTYTLEFSMQPGANKGNTVTLQVKHNGTTSWETVHEVLMTAGTQVNTFTFENDVFATSVVDYRLVIHDVGGETARYIWGFKVYEEVDVEVPIESEDTGAISSKITQLYDMINLSVLGKDGALSRIAVGEEGIQIDGKLLHITAKTFIDDAVIKSAMIDTLDAGKITTGELNAANVSIVNLDVNNLTGNAFNFVKGAFTSSSSRVSITGNGMDIIRNDGSRVIGFDDQGMDITGASGKQMGHIGHLDDGGYGEETVGVTGSYNTDLVIGYQHTAGTTYTPAIKIAKNTGSIRVSESTTFAYPVYVNSTFYLGDVRISTGVATTAGSTTANLAFPASGGQLRVANGDLFIRSSTGDYYSFKQLWNKVYS